MSLAIVYKSAVPNARVSYHSGLGICSMHVVKVLQAHKIKSELWGVQNGEDLWAVLAQRPDITHVVLQAPFFDTQFLRKLLVRFQSVMFTTVCHSNVGFLAIDSFSTKVLKENLAVENNYHNFLASGNSVKYCNAVKHTFRKPCLYLPNLYPLDNLISKPVYDGGEALRVGVFGAIRVMKNLYSGVWAGMQLGTFLNKDVVVSINVGREESGQGVYSALKELVKGVPHVTLNEVTWQDHAAFRNTVAHQHICINPSFTESHSLTTCDSIAEGVPVVVSPAMDWMPKKFQANPDDIAEIAGKALSLLRDRKATKQAYAALNSFNSSGVYHWERFLELGA